MTYRTEVGKAVRRLLGDETGATAIEYGLIASLIAVAAIQALEVLGTELTTTFSTVSKTMNSAADEAPPPAADEAPPVAPATVPT